ncbi:MAG: nickel-dependent lactate racemase [Acidobacteriia bacterium]|nr:nickel-dependent lactate racemase [Terriglobia bacterium]
MSAGSRGIANLRELVRAICDWLKSEGALPFIFPAMGSHGGATPEGQRKILEQYGVTSEQVGAEVRSSMAAAPVGRTAEGFEVYLDRHAWEADGVLVLNRVKPHTDFSGKIESGLLKMIAVGMGKEEGAREVHRWGWKFGFEHVIRAMSAVTLASGKILGGLAVVENEMHEVCMVRAARPESIAAFEQDLLCLARPLVPRIPFSKLQLLIVDELGKNVSGTGMDTKVIGRGVELQPGEAPAVDMIYVRDLTAESDGNALGVGFADVIHDRLFQKTDFRKTYLNCRVALNPAPSRLPIHLGSDREALDIALGHLGRPDPDEQRVVWIRNTQCLNRMVISAALTREAGKLAGWRLSAEELRPEFDADGNVAPVL